MSVLLKRISPFIFAILFVTANTYARVLPQVLTGADVLVENNFAEIAGKNVGLITNQTAVTRSGQHIADLLFQSEQVHLVALFSPEHGIRGKSEAGKSVREKFDPGTGLPVFSLYGTAKKPTREMLQNIDVLVFDIQDVGTRFYTFISTMSLALEAAAENNIPFVVLDRPNPISGNIVEGPVLDKTLQSFVGIHPIALRHGMTVGELAKMFVGEGWINDAARVRLTVIKMRNWQRSMDFKETGLEWIKPSPNMTNLQTALLYPGMGLLEATNISEGRGSKFPFQKIGAPWINGKQLKRCLDSLSFQGVVIDTTLFTPLDIPGVASHPKYLGKRCSGLVLTVTDPYHFHAVSFGIHLLCAVRDLYPNNLKINDNSIKKLVGSVRVCEMLENGTNAERIIQSWQSGLGHFLKIRKKYLLYNETLLRREKL